MGQAIPNLASYGISDAELIAHYAEYGGISLGLTLAERFAQQYQLCHVARTHRIKVPVSLDLTADARLKDIVEGGFAVKTSGQSESFSPHSARGVNSSRDRYWDARPVTEASVAIEAFAHNTNGKTASLVIQEYVTDVEPPGVIHVYAYDHHIILEHRHPLGTLVTDFEYGVQRLVGRVGEIGQISAETTGLDIDSIIQLAGTLRSSLKFDVDIELFQRRSGLCILQLRPIPNDVAIDADLDRHIRSLCADGMSGWVPLPFFSGVWNHQPVLYADLSAPLAALQKPNSDIRQCTEIMERLEAGQPTLVVDTVNGFRLSHDRNDLPELLSHRNAFSYVSLATTTYRPTPGERFHFLSSGLHAAIRTHL